MYYVLMCVYVCSCMYVLCVCVHVCMCVYVRMYVLCMYVCMYVCTLPSVYLFPSLPLNSPLLTLSQHQFAHLTIPCNTAI